MSDFNHISNKNKIKELFKKEMAKFVNLNINTNHYKLILMENVLKFQYKLYKK